VRRTAPGLTTYALIPAVRHGLPFVSPDDPTARLRGRVEGFWSDLAIVAKHHARRWCQAGEEAAALWSLIAEIAAEVGVAVDRPRQSDGLWGLLGEMDRVVTVAGLPGLDAAGRADALAWLEACEALRREGWTPGPGRGFG
jgi:hypothetical protein